MSILTAFSGLTFTSLLFFTSSCLFYFLCIISSQKLFSKISKEGDENLNTVLGAALSLLALLIGFSMSMSVGGYHDRLIAEQNEAITINSAYLKTYKLNETKEDMRDLLQEYLKDRISYYSAYNNQSLRNELSTRAYLSQKKMWMTSLFSADGNLIEQEILDIISSYQKTQAAWQNQIPDATWLLLFSVGMFCHILLGYGSRKIRGKKYILFILPLMVSLAFFIIAEIDVPGKGVIRVSPINLITLSKNTVLPQ